MIQLANRLIGKLKSTDLHTSNLVYYIINGMLFSLTNSVVKSYLPKFLDRIHGTPWHYTLYNALPGLMAVFATIPGMIWVRRKAKVEHKMASMFLMSRFFWLLFAIVPLLPDHEQPMVFVVLAAFMNFPEIISSTALQSYSADVFLPNQRVTAISLRNKYSTLAQTIALIALGAFLSQIRTGDKQYLFYYQMLFIGSFIIGLVEIKTFYKMKVKTPVDADLTSNINVREMCSKIFKNRKFRFYMICSLLFHFGWQMGWPLFTIYQIQYLGAGEGWLTILTVTQNIFMFISFGYWNRLILNRGNQFVLFVTTLGMAATPVLFAASPNLYIMTVTGLLTGFFTAGTLTVVVSGILEVAPEQEKTLYVGVHATLTNLTLAIAPLLGNKILIETNIYIALFATALFRLVGSISFFYYGRILKYQELQEARHV